MLLFNINSISPLNVQIISSNSHISFSQKEELWADRQKILSDEAKRLFQKEPGLLKATEEEFKSTHFLISPNSLKILIILIFVIQSL